MEEKLKEYIQKQKEEYLKKRDLYANYESSIENEAIQYLYQMKVNQIVGYIDALDDMLEVLQK